MSKPHLVLLRPASSERVDITFAEKLANHETILKEYELTLKMRNFSSKWSRNLMNFLFSWFKNYAVADVIHPDGERQLFVWEAMEYVTGQQRIRQYSLGLIDGGLKSSTQRLYLACLKRFFEYVLSNPFLPGGMTQSIASKYGPMEQPVSKYYYPIHTHDNEMEGFALTGEELLDFYEYVRSIHLPRYEYSITSMRNYTMIVLAGESGLRADEILHLDALGLHRDIFYKQEMLQVRFGKAAKGSGKRHRKSVFTQVAQDALRAYEEDVRPKFQNADSQTALFLSSRGQRISYREMWRDLKIIIEKAREDGLDLPPKFGWHGLRASFATNYIEQHGNRKTVLLDLIDLMGHISLGTLHRYLKYNKAYNSRAVEDFHNQLIRSN